MSAKRIWIGALGSVLVLVVATGGWIAATLIEIAPPDPVVHTASEAARRTLAAGEIVGFEGAHGDFGWQGIPFAAPPVGELRWRAPQPPAPWTGTLEALGPGPPCVQTSSPVQGLEGLSVGEIGGSEDCLTLNVSTPRFAAGDVPRGDARLPVIAADPRMEARDKCEMYRELVFGSAVLTPDSYPLAGDGGCGAYPIAEFPWDAPDVASAGDEEAG